MSPAQRAAELLQQHGAPEAWQVATRNAIDAHLSGDQAAVLSWMAVQQALRQVAPRPAPGDLDVYRTARLLIDQHGPDGARRFVEARLAAHAGNVMQQVLAERIARAVQALTCDASQLGAPGH